MYSNWSPFFPDERHRWGNSVSTLTVPGWAVPGCCFLLKGCCALVVAQAVKCCWASLLWSADHSHSRFGEYWLGRVLPASTWSSLYESNEVCMWGDCCFCLFVLVFLKRFLGDIHEEQSVPRTVPLMRGKPVWEGASSQSCRPTLGASAGKTESSLNAFLIVSLVL